jgi:hypothetical protein
MLCLTANHVWASLLVQGFNSDAAVLVVRRGIHRGLARTTR